MKSLRDEIPLVSEIVDGFREAFGAPVINAQIKAGMDGHGTFYAQENGIEVGSRPREIPLRVD